MRRLCEALVRNGVQTKTEYPLAEHSSFRIGGRAELAIFPKDRGELLLVLRQAASLGVPYVLIGKGSNVLFPDDGLRGAVIFTAGCRGVSIEGKNMTASAGESLFSLAVAAQRASLSGLEFAHGIPGPLGGALVMNAGAYGGCMGDVCVKSEYFDTETGEIGELCGNQHLFDYRSSIYEKNPSYAVLGATLCLKAGNAEEIRAVMEDYKSRRRASQPLEYPSAGSAFKRPVGYFAGKLIEDAGLKGYTVGGAQVSQKHAGFIINRGGATARDVHALVEHVQSTVLRQFGVELEPEIRFL